MKQAIRVGWVLVIVMLVCVGLDFQRLYETPSTADPSELYDVPWIDHYPKGAYEPFRMYLFVEPSAQSDRPNGMYRLAESSYKQHVEYFQKEVTATEIRYNFLHDRVKAVTGYKLEHQKPDADGLDLKLTLTRDPRFGGRSAVLYTNSHWHGGHQWPAVLNDPLGQ